MTTAIARGIVDKGWRRTLVPSRVWLELNLA